MNFRGRIKQIESKLQQKVEEQPMSINPDEVIANKLFNKKYSFKSISKADMEQKILDIFIYDKKLHDFFTQYIDLINGYRITDSKQYKIFTCNCKDKCVWHIHEVESTESLCSHVEVSEATTAQKHRIHEYNREQLKMVCTFLDGLGADICGDCMQVLYGKLKNK